MSVTAPPKLPRGDVLRVTGELSVGSVVDGKYRIESVLGRGGMAVVFGASHTTLGQAVALKVLRADLGGLPEQTERIVREARAAAGLTSENATRVLDIGELDSAEPYIVMERLVGTDLGRELAARGPVSVREAASYLVQACDAVAEAHAKGIVHRDLKPSNLFLTRRRDGSPLVKLMDFGISKFVADGPEQALTKTQDSLGTPHYMSPEQLMTSRDVDVRSDVWALGVILYQMLTGRRPFDGETTPAVHIAVASAPAPKLRDQRPDAPAPLDRLISACLVKSRAKRLQTVRAFARALLPFADEDTQKRYAHLGAPGQEPDQALVPNTSEGGVAAATDPETHAAWGTARSKSSGPSRRGLWLLGASAGAVAIVAAVESPRFTNRPASLTADAPAASSGSVAAGAPEVPPPPAEAPTAAPVPAATEAPSPPASAVPTASPIHRRPKPPAPAAPAVAPPRPDPYGQRR
jgi:eukaryotic-like serine/threonine-protein kinase